MVPGFKGGGAGAAVLLAILLYLLFSGGGDDEGGDPDRSGGTDAAIAAGGSVRADVVRVVDGDTIEVSIGPGHGGIEDVRYIGVDTPETVKPGEPVECFGPEASEFNRDLVEGRAVRLEFDQELRDIYDRLLAYVYVGDRFVNEELIRGGFARTLEIEPNTTRAGRLAEVQQGAGEAGRGLWGRC